MKNAKPIQEDWLVQLSAEGIPRAVCRVNESAPSSPSVVEGSGTDEHWRRNPSRQHLQQQLGMPQRLTHQAARQDSLWSNHEQTGPSARTTDERGVIASHLNCAMELAMSLQGPSVKRSYRERKTTGVLICRHLVAALKLEDAEFKRCDHTQ